jgi:hypothetical protein
MDEFRAAEGYTHRLRTSPEAGWDNLRQFLQENDIDPSRSALALLYRDDVATLVAIVVASPERMLEITLEYPPELKEEDAMNSAWVVEWHDHVERIVRENGKFVNAALKVLSA